jgi:hypothetical protein
MDTRIVATERVDESQITGPKLEILKLGKCKVDHIVRPTLLEALRKLPGTEVQIVTVDPANAEPIEIIEGVIALVRAQLLRDDSQPDRRCYLGVEQGGTNCANPLLAPRGPVSFNDDVPLVRQNSAQNETRIDANRPRS